MGKNYETQMATLIINRWISRILFDAILK